MSEKRYELLLRPRINTVAVSDKQLLTDLQRLQRSINKDAPLKLSLSADIPQSVGRIKADLQKIKPQLDNVLRVSIGVDNFESAKQTSGKKSTSSKAELENTKKLLEANKKIISSLKERLILLSKIAESNETTAKKISVLTDNLELNKSVFLSQIERSEKKWSAVFSDPKIKENIANLKSRLNEIENPEQLQNLKKEWQILSNVIGIAGKQQKSFADKVAETGGKLAAYFTSVLSYTLILSNLKKAYQTVIELDRVMGDLRKVSGLSGEVLNKVFDEAAKKAIILGTSIKDLLQSITDFNRLGYSIIESTALAEAAVVLSNVGVMSLASSTEGLTSIIKSFEIEASKAIGIVDKLTTADTEFAITAEGAKEALLRSSSALAAANNTFEESLALATAMNGILQSPEKVGTSLTTIAARLRNTSGRLAEMGEETDHTFESVSQLQQKLYDLTNQKVNIMIDSENFKSTFAVFKELSYEWKNLSDIQKAEITQILGGVQRSQAVSALIKKFGEAEDAIVKFSDSSGSALAKNEIMMDTVAKKAEQFGAQFEKTANSLIDSGLIKNFLDLIMQRKILKHNWLTAKILLLKR